MFFLNSELLIESTLRKWSTTNEKPELHALRNRKILFPKSFEMEPLDFSGVVDWEKYNTAKPTFRWHLNNMTYLRPLLQSKITSDILLASEVMKNWYEANPIGHSASDFAWDGHATALRSEQLACLKLLGHDEEWLNTSLKDHGNFLADPVNYQGNWNHGLDQNIGLLYIAAAIKNNSWADLARTRSIKAIEVMVDWESVSIEQAINYHHYNFIRLEDARNLFKYIGYSLPARIFTRLQGMAKFLAHATMPNGQWITIGDSSQVSLTASLSETPAAYAMSQGAVGIKPESRFGLFQAGYMFGRSGWGEEQSFNQEQYYTLRFGPARIIHGHNDHTSATFYTKGSPILIDGGFHGYTNDRWRAHLRSPQAHNVVYTTDEANFHWNEPTRMTDLKVEEKWQSFTLQDMPYHNTIRTRNILFMQMPFEAIIVLDRIIGPSRNYEQAWHFADDFSVTANANGALAIKGNIVVDVQQMWPTDDLKILKGQDAPLRGWAGYEVNDLRSTPVLLSSKAGRDISFLTVFIVKSMNEKLEVSQRRIRSGGVSRTLTITLGKKQITIEIQNHNLLRLAN